MVEGGGVVGSGVPGVESCGGGSTVLRGREGFEGGSDASGILFVLVLLVDEKS